MGLKYNTKSGKICNLGKSFKVWQEMKIAQSKINEIPFQIWKVDS